jgi:hypothetical protein
VWWGSDRYWAALGQGEEGGFFPLPDRQAHSLEPHRRLDREVDNFGAAYEVLERDAAHLGYLRSGRNMNFIQPVPAA